MTEDTQTTSESFYYRADIDDANGEPALTMLIETESGGAIQMKFRDRATLETLFTVNVPVKAAQGIGQALMLAATVGGS